MSLRAHGTAFEVWRSVKITRAAAPRVLLSSSLLWLALDLSSSRTLSNATSCGVGSVFLSVDAPGDSEAVSLDSEEAGKVLGKQLVLCWLP